MHRMGDGSRGVVLFFKDWKEYLLYKASSVEKDRCIYYASSFLYKKGKLKEKPTVSQYAYSIVYHKVIYTKGKRLALFFSELMRYNLNEFLLMKKGWKRL